MRFYVKNGIMLLSGLAFAGKKNPAVVKYTPSKTKLSVTEKSDLRHSTPERLGIPSQTVISMLNALESEERANIHSLVAMKDGEVFCECSRPGYSPRIAHLSHSMSKTVTGMLIGMLSDDGKLSVNDSLEKYFPEYDMHPKTAKITIENLLIMSSGISFSEAGAVTDTRWTQTFLESEPAFEEGTKFAYNSMNSYILMAIAHKIINEQYSKSVEEFLTERLFSPLGITEYFWEKGPEDIEKGGWGLYLSAESWAKLGQMMLGLGVFDRKRILSEEWVIHSTCVQSITPAETGDFNYGYQMWVARDNQDFLFNGMLGQNVLVIPKNNIVVAINSGNNELFQESPALKIIRDHLGGDMLTLNRPHSPSLKKKTAEFFESRMWTLPKEKRRGISVLLGLRSKTPFDEAFSPLLKRFVLAENNQGILPLFIRVMQNNYQGGISALEFKRSGDSLLLVSTEGEVEYTYKLGLYGYEYTDIDYCSEKYTVGALATANRLENGIYEWKIELIYPEMPNTRRLALRLNETGELLSISMTEIPNEKIAESFISSIYALGVKANFALDMLETHLGKNFIEKRVKELFSPTITAVAHDSSNFDALLAAENRKVSDALSSLALVRMMINRFTGTESEAADKEKSPSLGGMIFSTLLGKIFPRRNNGDENQ